MDNGGEETGGRGRLARRPDLKVASGTEKTRVMSLRRRALGAAAAVPECDSAPRVGAVRNDPSRRRAMAAGMAEVAVQPSTAVSVLLPLCSALDWASCRACRRCAVALDWKPSASREATGSTKRASAAVALAVAGRGAGLCPAEARAAFAVCDAAHVATTRYGAAGRAARAVRVARADRVGRAVRVVRAVRAADL